MPKHGKTNPTIAVIFRFTAKAHPSPRKMVTVFDFDWIGRGQAVGGCLCFDPVFPFDFLFAFARRRHQQLGYLGFWRAVSRGAHRKGVGRRQHGAAPCAADATLAAAWDAGEIPCESFPLDGETLSSQSHTLTPE